MRVGEREIDRGEMRGLERSGDLRPQRLEPLGLGGDWTGEAVMNPGRVVAHWLEDCRAPGIRKDRIKPPSRCRCLEKPPPLPRDGAVPPSSPP